MPFPACRGSIQHSKCSLKAWFSSIDHVDKISNFLSRSLEPLNNTLHLLDLVIDASINIIIKVIKSVVSCRVHRTFSYLTIIHFIGLGPTTSATFMTHRNDPTSCATCGFRAVFYIFFLLLTSLSPKSQIILYPGDFCSYLTKLHVT